MKTTTAAGRTWHFSHSIGRETAEHNGDVGGFMHPVDVAYAADGILFVLSRGFGHKPAFRDADVGKRIGKTTIDELHLGDFARNGFTWPTGIAISADGTVFCTDEYENNVSAFDPNGIVEFPEYDPDGESLFQWGESGAEPGQLSGPTGLTFDGDDNAVVVDCGNNRVQKFTREGRHLMGWGSQGGAEGEFDRPWGVTVDGEGCVYIADWGNSRVQKFTGEGDYLMTFGSNGQGNELDHPASVAIDSEGDVYVTDWGNRRVQVFEPNGDVITSLYGDVVELSKAGHLIVNRDPESIRTFHQVDHALSTTVTFKRPTGITITEGDRIVVADTRGRLLVYDKDNDYVAPTV